jgi:hypothetical protein
MANFSHGYPDLPTYGKDTAVAWTTNDIRKAAELGGATFVRRALLFGVADMSLRAALTTAKQTIDHTAEVLGTSCIAYTYGLYEGRRTHHEQDSRIPTGYSLVAEVQNIIPCTPLTSEQRKELALQVFRTHTGIRPPAARRTGFLLGDPGPRQFVSTIQSNTEPAVPVYVDIEPDLVTPQEWSRCYPTLNDLLERG